jgi:subtilase family serine protease
MYLGTRVGLRRTRSLQTVFRSIWFAFLVAGSVRGEARQTLAGHLPKIVRRLNLEPVGRLPADTILNLQIGLPPRNPQQFNDMLAQLYNPASPLYHHWLKPDQIAQNYGPSENDYKAVIDFVEKNGFKVIKQQSDRTFLSVNGSVRDVEKMLHVKMQIYQHPTESRTFYAPDSEPALDLSVPLLHITGLDNLHISHPETVTPSAQGGVQDYEPTGTGPLDGAGYPSFWGYDFRHAYLPGTSLTGAGQSIGLFSKQAYNPADIAAYENDTGLPPVSLQNILVDNVAFDVTTNTGGETSLDIEMAASMAPGAAGILLYQGTNDLDILKRMQTDNIAKQLSSSWSLHGDPNMDSIFIQMAMQGQSFLQSSGDHGAYTAENNGDYADDPYITIVGGTKMATTAPGGPWASEIVWPGSGGGISGTYLDDYSIPSWQQGVGTSSNDGSPTQRNSPDVAMIGNDIWNLGPNGSSIGDGTSFSTPLWAGFIALANQQAVASGQPTVGFINPVIYAIGSGSLYPACFNDITSGNNTNASSPNEFYATPGYDLCTGWGSPTSNLITLLAQTSAAVWVDFYASGFENGSYQYPYATLAQAISVVPGGGVIAIKANVQPSQTSVALSITKPLTIISFNGPSIIGN